jgi:tRNA-dihydrouridine synthase 2
MTIDFAKSLEQAGAMAIGIHARHVHERPMDDAHWEALTPVVDALNIPVLANGDVFVREDIEKARKITGANSFLIARGALMNASIFREEGMLPPSQVVVDYLKVVAETDNVFQNSKYNVARMIPTKISTCTEETSKVTVAELGETKNNLQMFQLWNLQDFYHTKQRVFETRAKEFNVTKEGYQKLVPLHRYDDQHILNRDLYCDLCGIQLLGEKDIALHLNGRKHRNKMKQSLITQNNSTEIENIEPKEDGNSRTKIPVSKKLKTTSSL